jgi:uncharacterized protein
MGTTETVLSMPTNSASYLSSQLAKAVVDNDLQKTEQLINKGANPNAIIEGRSILDYAIGRDISFVRLLLGRGANPNLATFGGMTPLAMAVIKGNPEMVTMLIDSGAHVNTVMFENTDREQTALEIASRMFQPEIVKILLKHAANKSHRNDKGQTALEYQREARTRLKAGKEDPKNAQYAQEYARDYAQNEQVIALLGQA